MVTSWTIKNLVIGKLVWKPTPANSTPFRLVCTKREWNSWALDCWSWRTNMPYNHGSLREPGNRSLTRCIYQNYHWWESWHYIHRHNMYRFCCIYSIDSIVAIKSLKKQVFIKQLYIEWTDFIEYYISKFEFQLERFTYEYILWFI